MSLVKRNARTRSKSFIDRRLVKNLAGEDDETPLSRRRHKSEGEKVPVSRLATHKVPQASTLRYKKYHRDEGTHQCDGNTFHLSNKFANNGCIRQSNLNKTKLNEEIKKTLFNCLPGLTPAATKSTSAEIFWNRAQLLDLAEKSPNPTDLKHIAEESPLKILLASINKHVQKVSGNKSNYNGLKIIYNKNRECRVAVRQVTKDTSTPLVLLHIGRPRDLSVTPFRFNPGKPNPSDEDTCEVCDITMENYSLLTIFKDGVDKLHCYFAPQQPQSPLHTGEEASPNDGQILLIPYVEVDLTDDSNTNDKLGLLTVTTEPEHKVPHRTISSVSGTDSVTQPNDTSSYPGHVMAKNTAAEADQVSYHGDSPKAPELKVPARSTPPTKAKGVSDIHLKEINSDLLLSVINMQKKSALRTMMAACELESTNNTANSKLALCNIIKTAEETSSEYLLPLLKTLIPKINSAVIRKELSKNGITLSQSAAQRSKDLINHLETSAKNMTKTKLIIDEIRHDKENMALDKKSSLPELNVNKPDNHVHKVPIDTKSDPPTKTEAAMSNEPANSRDFPGDSCNSCQDLRKALSVLQESVLQLSQEVSQNKATIELLLSDSEHSKKNKKRCSTVPTPPLSEIKEEMKLMDVKVSEEINRIDCKIKDEMKRMDCKIKDNTVSLKAIKNKVHSSTDKLNTAGVSTRVLPEKTTVPPSTTVPTARGTSYAARVTDSIKTDSVTDVEFKPAGPKRKPRRENKQTTQNNLNKHISKQDENEVPIAKPAHNYRNHTVLLVHDENFDDFSPKQFSNRFNVHRFKASSLHELFKDKEKLNSTILKLKPDCIYIHTGINDVIKKKSGVTNATKSLLKHLAETTKAQICISKLIPTTNDNDLNKKIKLVNDEIHGYVNWLHQQKDEARERIFTYSNNSVGFHNTYVRTIGFELTEHGQKLLWIRFREGIKKTLRLPRAHTSTKSRTHTHRQNTNNND